MLQNTRASAVARLAIAIVLSSAVTLVMAAPLGAELTPVIVRFKANLPSKAPDLKDGRIGERHNFGNLAPSVMGHIQDLEGRHRFKAEHGFSTTLQGFSARLTAAQIASLKSNANVELIEPDAPLRLRAQTVPYGIAAVGATVSGAALAGDGLANAAPGLANVRVLVLDTGVASHPDLNVVSYTNLVGDGIDGDCVGHGTHVAGIIGARDNALGVVGVAPGVPIEAVKIMDCSGSGSASTLIKALDNAAAEAKANPTLRYVANLSSGFATGTVVASLDTALKNAVAAGVFVGVAAGNTADNACATSMTRLSSGSIATGVMAVGAVDAGANEATFSSFGSCIANWAPGVNVLSTYLNGTLASMSGSSMATPHTVGAAALVRAVSPGLTPVDVDAYLKATARPTKTNSKDGRAIVQVNVQGLGGSPSAATPVANPAPSPRPTAIVSVETPNVGFGTAKLRGPNVRRVIPITNTGSAPLTITGLANFPTMMRWVASSCFAVAPGARCALTLEMTTSQVGSFKMAISTLGAATNGSFTVVGFVVR